MGKAVSERGSPLGGGGVLASTFVRVLSRELGEQVVQAVSGAGGQRAAHEW